MMCVLEESRRITDNQVLAKAQEETAAGRMEGALLGLMNQLVNNPFNNVTKSVNTSNSASAGLAVRHPQVTGNILNGVGNYDVYL